MFNINKSIQSDYRPASKTFKKASKFSPDALYAFFIGFLLSLRDLVIYLWNSVFNPKKAIISGDLVLVTGGGNGLGKALASRFAQEGCDVAIADLDLENALKTADEIRERFKVNCKAFRCDISNYTEVLKLKSDIESEMRAVDILVNNAGLLYMSNFCSSDVNDIQRVVDVNLTSQIKMTHTFLPSMVARRRGRIVTVSSLTALHTMPSAVVYSSTKWGVRGFMTCLRDEMLINNYDKFIKLTTVFPDFINTRRDLVEVLDKIDLKTPRLTPERVADDTVNGVLAEKLEVFVSDVSILAYLAIMNFSAAGRKAAMRASSGVQSLFNPSH